MRIVKRVQALCLSLLVQMMNVAQAEVPFLVHSDGWALANTPVDVLLKADVSAHLPFAEDRLAMLAPIIDVLALRLVTGEDEGLVTIVIDGEDALTMQYQGDAVQLSSMPEITYTSRNDTLTMLLGTNVSVGDGYEALGLAPERESLLMDGRELLKKYH